jgi:type II secretory pathway component PulF
MLAMLLDAGVPEPEALSQAGEATASLPMIRRTHRATKALREGAALPEALALVDDSGELRWRIQNAAHGSGGFLKALRGWHDALDAKAFQLEQAAAQVTTTVLVLVNGLIVGIIVIGLFQALTQIINGATLW